MLNNKSTSPRVIPTFIYIGAPKSGTSWMFEILREHPEVFVPIAKDIMFFDRYYDKGMNWYLSFFKNSQEKKAVGELSHNYYYSADAAKRIYQSFPNVKLICCLREIVDKMISNYTFSKTTVIKEDIPFEEYVQKPLIQHQMEYYNNLKVYFDIFPRDNILLLYFDDLKKDPIAFVRQLYGFLGVDPDFQPPSLHRRINVSRKSRIDFISYLAADAVNILRKFGLANLVGAVKRSSLFNTLLYKPLKEETVSFSPEVLDKLHEQYCKEYVKLEKLIGQPLPETWFTSYNQRLK